MEKCGIFFEKQPFFRADMAGLGRYHTGGYGRIGVYRINDDFPTFDVLCKSFLYKINHKKKFNIFRVGPKIRVGRDT